MSIACDKTHPLVQAKNRNCKSVQPESVLKWSIVSAET